MALGHSSFYDEDDGPTLSDIQSLVRKIKARHPVAIATPEAN
jgi:NAD(P)H-dependent FMN reductase